MKELHRLPPPPLGQTSAQAHYLTTITTAAQRLRAVGLAGSKAASRLTTRGRRCITSKRLATPDIQMLRGAMTEQDFRTGVFANPINKELLGRLASLGLGECNLTAGCLFQTIWNQISGRDPEWGIKDYDVFYFDDRDLSWNEEDRVIREVAEITADLPVRVEVRNQARVHLWYPQRFGGDYPQLTSTRSGIDLYLISCTCVGIDAQTGGLYAPNGLGDLASGLLRQNPLNPKPDLFRQKAQSYQQRWPWLEIVE